MTLTNQDLADEFRRVVAADPQRHGAVVVRGLLTIAADRLAPTQESTMEPLCPICEKVFTEGQEVVIPQYFDCDRGGQPIYSGNGEKYHKDCFQALYVHWKQDGVEPERPIDHDAVYLDLEQRKVAALEAIAVACQRPTITVGSVSYSGPIDEPDPTIEALVATHTLGFTQTVDPEAEEAVNGFTCTACGQFVELPEDGGFTAEEIAFLEEFHQDDVRVTVTPAAVLG